MKEISDQTSLDDAVALHYGAPGSTRQHYAVGASIDEIIHGQIARMHGRGWTVLSDIVGVDALDDSRAECMEDLRAAATRAAAQFHITVPMGEGDFTEWEMPLYYPAVIEHGPGVVKRHIAESAAARLWIWIEEELVRRYRHELRHTPDSQSSASRRLDMMTGRLVQP